jgi:hypothetical protein
MAIWNYRGALEDEWQKRKEAVGLTTDECLILGIKTAEKEQAKNLEESGK